MKNSTIAIDHYNEMKGDFTIEGTIISILGKCFDGTLNLEYSKGNDEWVFQNVAARAIKIQITKQNDGRIERLHLPRMLQPKGKGVR